ncbi:PrsW family intramembrane metalloprotease [Halomicrococcus sp. NG-SE-24]|uniref:PrsW family intramembrane metalloprotease n=1 Tax=Halomicrococcus sp. NG-SE-24 TaxID=3436928 RepID=UPI003D9648AC
MKLRKTLRIARWEARSNAGRLDRRTLAVLAAVVLLIGALAPMVASRGNTVDDGIYRVAIPEDSPYYEPAVEDPESKFVVVEPTALNYRTDRVEVFVCPEGLAVCPPGEIAWDDDPKGRAALAELRATVRAYNDRAMAEEPDRAAAFPVNVTLLYAEQNRTGAGPGASDGDRAVDRFTTRTTAAGEKRLGGGTGGSAGGTPEGDAGSGSGGETGGAVEPPAVGGGSSLFGSDQRRGTPSNIAPPFPFESLVLAFAFVLPMNFVIQAYASSVLDERINRRGELLLVSPVSRVDVVAGKTLPYFAGMVAIASATAVGIVGLTGAGGSGALSVAATATTAVAAVAPIALLFLACAFVGGMFARSFKELTFVTVSLSVFLTAYAFVPAIFTDVHPVAAISPLTLVVRALRGDAVPLADYAFSTLPLVLSAGVLFALGLGVYREEDMFTQRSVPLKFLDALDGQISGRRSVAKLSALSIPFVFVGELLAVALLFALPVDVSVPVLLVAIAGIEEVAKSVHVYAGYAHGRFDSSPSTVGVLGALSGLGFFLGEKVTAVAQPVGLPNLELGKAAFGTATGLGVEASPLVLVGLLFAPLALHTATATVTAYGAREGREWYLGTLVTATLVHAAYNVTVVSSLG